MSSRELLRSVGIFSTLTDAELDTIAGECEYKDLSDGEVIYEAGTTEEELFVIERGSVRIVRADEEGSAIDLARFVAGESFGEQDLMSAEPREATAIADGPTRIIAFPGGSRKLSDLIHDNPQLFAKVLHQLLVLVAGRIRRTNQLVSENTGWIQQLRNQVFGDKLTGLLTKNYLADELPGVLGRCANGAAFLMTKPDNFKIVNDTYGHDAGDKALRILAERLKSALPEGAIAIRYMGNENGVVVPNLDREHAIELAREIFAALSTVNLDPIAGAEDPPLEEQLTFSVGIAMCCRDATAAEELAEAAHDSLFAAREAGGNRIHCAGVGVVPTTAEATDGR